MSLSDLFQKAALVHKEKPIVPVVRASTLRWTDQQEEVLQSSSPKVLIKALAGTGKTSTLLEYARRRPEKKWHFLVFNRATAEEIQIKSPKNVRVKTVHQLGFSKFAQHVSHKIKDKVSIEDFSSLIPSGSVRHPHAYAKHLMLSMEYYCHHRLCWSEMRLDPKAQAKFQISEQAWQDHLQFWWSQAFLENSPLPLLHDMYVKRLAQSDFSWDGHWMLDEAQDWSEAFYDSFAHKTQSHVIVGDPYQTLYRFRHAQGTMLPLEDHQVCWLTQSQRQGHGVEDVVNGFLKPMGCPEVWQGNPSFACEAVSSAQSVETVSSFAPEVFLAYDHDTLSLARQQYGSFGASFMTIHASKGLEFERVWVLDHDLPLHLPLQDRLALQYVSSTRSKTHLRLPPSWLSQNLRVEHEQENGMVSFEDLIDEEFWADTDPA